MLAFLAAHIASSPSRTPWLFSSVLPSLPDAYTCRTPWHLLHHLLRALCAQWSFPIAGAVLIASSRAKCVSNKLHSPRSTHAGRLINTARTTPECAALAAAAPHRSRRGYHLPGRHHHVQPRTLLRSNPAPVRHRKYDAQPRRSAQQVQRAFPSSMPPSSPPCARRRLPLRPRRSPLQTSACCATRTRRAPSPAMRSTHCSCPPIAPYPPRFPYPSSVPTRPAR
jgi:hypothetical protein